MRRIRYEPFLEAYLIMENGELYSVLPADIKEILEEIPDAIIVKNLEYPKETFSAPIKVQIQVTNFCNLRCKTCAVFSGDNKIMPPQMTHKQIMTLLERSADVGVLNIEWSGGEPLFRKGFWTFVKYAEELGFAQNLLTNGLCFSDKNIECLHVFFRIQISLDGVGETFNQIVNRDAWRLFTRSINLIREKELNIVIATVLQEKNVDRLGEIIEFCAVHNFKKIRISPQVPIGRSKFISWTEYCAIINRFRDKLPDLKRYAEDCNIELDTFLEKKICDDETVKDVLRIVSPGGYSFLYIDAVGDIFPFPFLNQPSWRLGSCLSDNLSEIWLSSDILNKIRQQTYQNTGCGKCRYECSFADRSLVFGFTGKIDGPALPHIECKERR
ncbi:MAG: radical SAM protein [Candidatus Paceibacterota bacterium]